MMVAQLIPARLLKATAARTRVGQVQCAAVDGGLRANTGPVLGLTHIDSHEQQVRLRHVCFTRFGVSALLLQSHETLLLV